MRILIKKPTSHTTDPQLDTTWHKIKALPNSKDVTKRDLNVAGHPINTPNHRYNMKNMKSQICYKNNNAEIKTKDEGFY